jgi:hypothetical protein
LRTLACDHTRPRLRRPVIEHASRAHALDDADRAAIRAATFDAPPTR